MRRTLLVGAVVLIQAACARQATLGTNANVAAGGTGVEVPSLDAIRADDLKRDLFALAGDAMRGREAGTLDELRASGWLVEQVRAIGLEPAGEDGTYYQWWPMRRIRQSDASVVRVGGESLKLWRDVVVASAVDANVDLPIVFVGRATDAELAGVDLTGKAVAALIVPPPNPPGRNVSLSAWRYAGAAVRAQSARLTSRGAAAVVLVADSVVEGAIEFYGAVSARGTYGLDTAGAVTRPRAAAPVLLVRQRMIGALQATGARLSAMLTSESFTYPSVNIVAKLPGSDATLRNEYVLFSGHQDHDGVRFPIDGDSIWNGADDNATVSVAMLAIARAWKQQPSKRSALWVWHGAEERGLLGSRWHAMKPMVPRDQIVAVLNADMIGRNHLDSASLLGIQPPHRNSSDLVAHALRANQLTGRFTLDSLWDRPTHPEGWYFRSDHLPYARLNIPAVMYSTNLHPDYHTPRDNPDRIDIDKLRRMTQWMYATGWLVGTAAARPRVDAGFRLER
ncbi:MAG: M28 family peptidase [Gemmatimonadetes bacterium]|nr:M28 family peptidase [Gemmatimonadota bacterium]